MPSTTGPAPSAPPAAAALFGDRLPLAEAYAGWLAGAGVVRGLIGPREAPRLWERHLLNCAVLAEALPRDAAVVDVGSGAGLPGLVLAIVRPDLHLAVLEPLLRRSDFLSEVVADLRLDGVEVLRGRAEDITDRQFDVTVSRAVAPLPRLVDWCLPLTRVGGAMVAMKGERAADEVAAVPPAAWGSSGLAAPEVLAVGVGVVDPPVTLVRVARTREARVRLGGRGGAGARPPRRRGGARTRRGRP